MNLKKFVLEGNPVCRKEAVIVGDHFRITMLTTALIRFEYSEDGGFEDRATPVSYTHLMGIFLCHPST